MLVGQVTLTKLKSLRLMREAHIFNGDALLPCQCCQRASMAFLHTLNTGWGKFYFFLKKKVLSKARFEPATSKSITRALDHTANFPFRVIHVFISII